MEKTDDFRELAFLYFDGKISRPDESRLYAFISASRENKVLFRRWEQEWLATEDDDRVVEKGWNSLQQKLSGNRILSIGKGRQWLPGRWLRYTAAAVVVACVSVFSTLLVTDSFEKGAEKQFVFETPKGERSRLTLADGTVVWLNSGSTLRCSGSFDIADRRVEITGEAYFEVTRQGGRQFTVSTGTCDVVVKGTKFDVMSYADDDYVQATLLEGKIEFHHAGKTVQVAPGEQVRVAKASGKLTRTRVNAGQYSAWTEGRIEFDRITLGELLPKLARHYDVDFHLQTDSLAGKSLRISVRNEETVHDVMKALAEIMQVNITTEGRDIYIR